MSKIDEQIKKLREQEKRLELEKLKVEFLTHILGSVQSYNENSFASVKGEVMDLLEPFIKKSIEAIETGSTIEIVLKSATAAVVPAAEGATFSAPEKPAEPKKPRNPEDSISVQEKSTFALDNRHLGGKTVSVINDKSVTITGKVVGLDAPYVIVKTDSGPMIKVPLDKVSLG